MSYKLKIPIWLFGFGLLLMPISIEWLNSLISWCVALVFGIIIGLDIAKTKNSSAPNKEKE